jgi:hypothetical protein
VQTLHGTSVMITHQREFDGLVSALLPFSRHMLLNHGAFLPLGAIVLLGEVRLVAADLDRPDATVPERLQLLTAALREHAAGESCAAVAYCVDVRVTAPDTGARTDAIQIAFEHRSGEALNAIFPYAKNGDGYQFGQPILQMATRRIFDSMNTFVN